MTLAAAARRSPPAPPQVGPVSFKAPGWGSFLLGQRLQQQRAAAVSYVNIGNAIGSVLQDGVQINYEIMIPFQAGLMVFGMLLLEETGRPCL